MDKRKAQSYLRRKAHDGTIALDGVFYRVRFGKSLETSLPRMQDALTPLDGEILGKHEYQTRASRFDTYRTYSEITFSVPVNQDPLWDMTLENIEDVI